MDQVQHKLEEYQASLKFNMQAYMNLLESIKLYMKNPTEYEKEIVQAKETKEKLEMLMELDRFRIKSLKGKAKGNCSIMGGFRTRKQRKRKGSRKV